MLLAVDIGNTSVVAGIFDRDQLTGSFRATSQLKMTADEAGSFLGDLLQRLNLSADRIDKVVIGSVVPPLTSVFEQATRSLFGLFGGDPVIVTARIKLPVRIEIDQPDEVGADRIANAAAAVERYGGPAIVVDFGTATTFDVINEAGAYIGGVIIPGPETAMADLAQRAAKLFEIRIEPPEQVVGKSTAGALKSGLFFGTVGQVDYIVERIIEETGFENCTIVATGGLAGGIEKHSRHIKQVEPNLTLDGLRLIADMN